MMLKKRAALLTGMAVFAIAVAFYRLEHWRPHEENPLIILLTFVLMPTSAVLALKQIVQGIRTKCWLWLVVGVLAAAVCLWGALTCWPRKSWAGWRHGSIRSKACFNPSGADAQCRGSSQRG